MTRPGTIPSQVGFESRIFRSRGLRLKVATSQVAGSPAVLDPTVIVLDPTVITIYGGHSFLRLLGAVRHTSAPALLALCCLSGDRYICPALVYFLGPGVAPLTTRPPRRSQLDAAMGRQGVRRTSREREMQGSIINFSRSSQTISSHLIYPVVWLSVGAPLSILQPVSSTLGFP